MLAYQGGRGYKQCGKRDNSTEHGSRDVSKIRHAQHFLEGKGEQRNEKDISYPQDAKGITDGQRSRSSGHRELNSHREYSVETPRRRQESVGGIPL